MTDRNEAGARALRLVLACIEEDDSALSATVAEFDTRERDLVPTVKFLAGLTAGVWTSALGHDAAVNRVAFLIDQHLKAAAAAGEGHAE